jgi:predicted transcriptional regulator of viral defense system
MKVRELPDALLGEGRHTVSSQELLELTGLSGSALRSGLHRLREDGSMVSPARGFYAVVPPQYRAWGAPPAEWFIDEMMGHLGRRYYVALLTAAGLHGGEHQAVQSFQVMVGKGVADLELGRERIRFYTSEHVGSVPVERRNGPSGYLCVATRETTAVDLVERPRRGGGLSNVATVLIELGALEGAVVGSIAAARGKATARRLGWLLQRYRPDVELEQLRAAARPQEGEPALLSSGGSATGVVDTAWGLRVNENVDPDL